ncbi:MAG: hypothetical protein SVG88_11395 [Halobacteriales archaeon]|nr:hypothetical protein [Halobacteriales archaeon]
MTVHTPDEEVEFGDAWVYESIVGALPWIDLSDRMAVVLQFLLFEFGIVVLAWIYDLWMAALAGSVAVLVATIGSAFMLNLGNQIRGLQAPESYRRLLFGSSIEVVLSLLAYVGLLTYLFVYDPRTGGSLLTELLGERPPLPVVYLMLLILWDVCYRIGTGWWAAVAALFRSLQYRFDTDVTAGYRRIDRRNAGFAVVQLSLVPLVWGYPLLVGALVGHVIAVLVVVAASLWLLGRSEPRDVDGSTFP